ncbi:MAG: tetratricopeptide repeat-containing diguanylate cyclase [Pseudomonadota bacterium]
MRFDPATIVESVRQAQREGRLSEAEALAIAALEDRVDSSNTAVQIQIMTSLSEVYIELNRYDEAERFLLESLHLLGETDPSSERGNVLLQLARVHRYRADYASALSWLHQSRDEFALADDTVGTLSVYNTYGVIYRFLGQLEQSLEWHQRSMAIARQIGDGSGVADGLFNIASIHESLGEYDEALRYYEDALELDRADGTPRNIAYSHVRLGMVLIELGQLASARNNVETAMQLFASIDTPRDYQWSLATMARIESLEDNADDARDQLLEVLAISEAEDWPVLANRARQWLAEVELSLGSYGSALQHIEAALDDAIAQKSMQRVLWLHELQAKVLEAADRPNDALQAMRQRIAVSQQLSDSMRTSVLAAMQGEVEFERQAIALELAQKDRKLATLALERESIRQRMWIVSLIVGFVIAFMLYNRRMAHLQNLRLAEEVAVKTQALRERNAELTDAYDAVDQASLTDSLTGLSNRRFLERHIDSDIARSVRLWQERQLRSEFAANEAADLVFLLIDIDHFKQVNDEYGHDAGDAVLKSVGACLLEVTREEDYAIRWGGEEFLVVARFVDRLNAPFIAEKIRNAIAARGTILETGQVLKCTCSIGFAALPFDGTHPERYSWQDVVCIADHALYASKQAGRHRWTGYHPAVAVVSDDLSKEWIEQALESGVLEMVSATE